MIPFKDFVSKAKEARLRPGERTNFNHLNCTAGKDLRSRLYVLRTHDRYIAYCHNCGEYGVYTDISSTHLLPISELAVQFEKEQREAEQQPVLRNDDVWFPADANNSVEQWPSVAKNWVNGYISDEQVRQYSISYSPSLGRVMLPVFDDDDRLVYWQGRRIAPETDRLPKYLNAVGVPKQYFFAHHPRPYTHPSLQNSLVIVEDYMSAIVVSSLTDALCVFGKTIDLALAMDYIRHYNRIGIMLDGDVAGRTASKKKASQLALLRATNIIPTPIGFDPKDLVYEPLKALILPSLGESH